MRKINLINNNGSIQLRFSVQGKKYGLNPVLKGRYGDPKDMVLAEAMATKIEYDILAGVFDPTLRRYKPKQVLEPIKEKPTSFSDLALPLDDATGLIKVWDVWVASLNLPMQTKANHYNCIRQMIIKCQPLLYDVDWLVTANLAASTFNKRLGYLNACFKWALKCQIVDTNPYAELKSKKQMKDRIQPFTEAEIHLILEGFEQKFPHYKPFVTFLLLTGCRPSEAIGLLWKHVNFVRSEVTICESLSRDRTGNGYRTVRKTTKTGIVRHLNMSNALIKLFSQLPRKAPNELVFTSAKGCSISLDNFREDWRVVLNACGVEYRKPYTMRHSLISYAIEQGIPITGVAYIAGHVDTRMVMQTYGHLINRPDLPEIRWD